MEEDRGTCSKKMSTQNLPQMHLDEKEEIIQLINLSSFFFFLKIFKSPAGINLTGLISVLTVTEVIHTSLIIQYTMLHKLPFQANENIQCG